MNESISVIKTKLATLTDPADPYILGLATDQRSGVQKLLAQFQRKILKQQQLQAQFEKMREFERTLYENGVRFVAGIDEVGRGPLAGPVVSAAVILPTDFQLLGINDSKQLSAKKRGEYFQQIQAQAVAIGIGVVDQTEIDTLNIYQASKKAMLIAVNDLAVQPEHLLVDAMTLPLDLPQDNLIKGDARSISIAAASIVAKELRDNLMKEYHQVYPHYGFDRNAGYGTQEHLTGLAQYGITPIHRKTFAPVKNYLDEK